MSTSVRLATYVLAIAGVLTLRSHLSGQVAWTRVGEAPVLGAGPPGAWDSYLAGHAFVLDDGLELKLWYLSVSGLPYDEKIGLATSIDGGDGIVWEKEAANPVFPGIPGTWQARVNDCCVLGLPGGGYAMWYFALPENTAVGAIGRATSPDGINWLPGTTPVLPANAAWEGAIIGNPTVLFDGATYRMWYSGGETTNSSGIGYATSADGIEWKKYPANPVLKATPENPFGVYRPFVLFDGKTGTYEMWFTIRTPEVDAGGSTTGYATSADGIAWCRYDGNPVLAPTEAPGWDSGFAISPAVLFDGNSYRMWYTGGLEEAGAAIGYATSQWTIPKVSFTVLPRPALDSLTIDVDATRSATPNPPLATYAWDFGDDSAVVIENDPTATHTYAQPGHYVVKLTVTDTASKQGAVARGVDVQLSGCDLAPWTLANIGEPLFPGAACLEGEADARCLRLSAGGRLLSGTSDQLVYVHQQVAGDVVLTARIDETLQAKDGWEVGVMLRESLDPGSRHVSMLLAKDNQTAESRFRARNRPRTDGFADRTNGEAATAPVWVQVAHEGDTFIASSSKDGITWTGLEPVTLPDAPDTIFAGIVAAGRDVRADGSFLALQAKVCVALGPPVPPGVPFRRGDCNGDGGRDIADAIFHLGFLFGGKESSDCPESCDANGDAGEDLSDAVYLLAHLFAGGPAPEAPFPDCGPDPEPAASLGCTRLECQ